MKESINNYEDLLEMLDALLREPAPFWNEFYTDRDKGVPFFSNKPDENLVSYFEKEWLRPGKVLELGCGPGRNALYFSELTCEVDAVDLSETSLKWATERAKEKGADIRFIQKNIFDLEIGEGSYDIVYDSGCFHHIAPHRKMSYIDLVSKALKPGGHFAITCFIEGGALGGADLSDWDVYRKRSLMGGLGFTEEKLRTIFKDFKELEIRKMNAAAPSSNVFGVNGLWTALFKKNK
ncbi:class I SAM-dependent methyltransferase [Cytobacillus purgationiresistens]|uniref:SAM-dependent methyltransferase n=1 Tax=Cytobacillus purgationiresistens TaxID=863449 RepID=A0ABU0ANT1_9BACI|nr:class I SAM-dependent methyltransferase [Cytobacillus purgationiresistens]MDQ0272843.1 SAM-dependent methyltransferase [Cytobacillus purgationiresistens]